MPSADTFSVPDIGCFVQRYLLQATRSIDPFSRNSRLCDYTNDLNPDTKAECHMDAVDFLKRLSKGGTRADLVIFDPPYSPRQISECYQQVGRKCGMEETQSACLYSAVRDAIMPVLMPNGIVLSFGWNTVGMGKGRGFEVLEIMLVCHGGAHNDTICMAERMVQPRLI